MINLSKIKIFGLGGLSESGKNSYIVEVDDTVNLPDDIEPIQLYRVSAEEPTKIPQRRNELPSSQ